MADISLGADAGRELFGAIAHKLEQLRDDAVKKAKQSIDASTKEGMQIARKRIAEAATETGRTRVARGGNGPGRIDKGDYINDFTRRPAETGVSTATGKMGWINETPGLHAPHRARASTYFELQDTGFQSVTGTHAMFDAWIIAKARYKGDLTKYVRETFK